MVEKQVFGQNTEIPSNYRNSVKSRNFGQDTVILVKILLFSSKYSYFVKVKIFFTYRNQLIYSHYRELFFKGYQDTTLPKYHQMIEHITTINLDMTL